MIDIGCAAVVRLQLPAGACTMQHSHEIKISGVCKLLARDTVDLASGPSSQWV